jgi:hypothetical protein
MIKARGLSAIGNAPGLAATGWKGHQVPPQKVPELSGETQVFEGLIRVTH